MPQAQELNARILVLGYSDQLQGGVTKVTNHLLKHMPEMELHAVLHGYNSRIDSLFRTLTSFLSFCAKLTLHPGSFAIAHIIVGSPGDAVRTLPFILVATLARLKICLQYHKSTDIILAALPETVIQPLVLRVWELADIHAFLSSRLSDMHKDLIHSRVSSIIIPNALDDGWQNLEVLPMVGRSRDIVFFGRWSWEKGVDDLVKAMTLLTSDALCECYTNPPPGVSPARCRLFPWISEGEVMQIMRTARLLVLPSYAEAYPTVLLEAAACGTPFVATEIAGIPDIVNESGAGILVKPGDAKGLAAAIDRFMTDDNLWATCSARGKEWVSRLNTGTIVGKWRETYREILGT